jgi:hypothetical protein
MNGVHTAALVTGVLCLLGAVLSFLTVRRPEGVQAHH